MTRLALFLRRSKKRSYQCGYSLDVLYRFRDQRVRSEKQFAALCDRFQEYIDNSHATTFGCVYILVRG
jgi:hypothetical protein